MFEQSKWIYPVNIRAHVEYAVTAWSCSPSNANVWPNATQAGPNRGSMSEVLLVMNKSLIEEWKQYFLLPEILSCLGPFPATQIPHSNRIPANRIFWLPVDHLMSQNKEFRMEMRKMVHACNMQGHGLVVNGNKTKNPIIGVKFERPTRWKNTYLEVIVKQSAQRKLE